MPLDEGLLPDGEPPAVLAPHLGGDGIQVGEAVLEEGGLLPLDDRDVVARLGLGLRHELGVEFGRGHEVDPGAHPLLLPPDLHLLADLLLPRRHEVALAQERDLGWAPAPTRARPRAEQNDHEDDGCPRTGSPDPTRPHGVSLLLSIPLPPHRCAAVPTRPAAPPLRSEGCGLDSA